MAPYLGGSPTNQQSNYGTAAPDNHSDANELRRANTELRRANTELRRATELQRANQNETSNKPGELVPNGLIVNTSISNSGSNNNQIEIDSPASANIMLASIIEAMDNRARARAQAENRNE